jgi:hypothetical protein
MYDGVRDENKGVETGDDQINFGCSLQPLIKTTVAPVEFRGTISNEEGGLTF